MGRNRFSGCFDFHPSAPEPALGTPDLRLSRPRRDSRAAQQDSSKTFFEELTFSSCGNQTDLHPTVEYGKAKGIERHSGKTAGPDAGDDPSGSAVDILILLRPLQKAVYGKAAYFPVGVISQAEQGNPSNKNANPSEAKNDPQQHHSYRFTPALPGWSLALLLDCCIHYRTFAAHGSLTL